MAVSHAFAVDRSLPVVERELVAGVRLRKKTAGPPQPFPASMVVYGPPARMALALGSVDSQWLRV